MADLNALIAQGAQFRQPTDPFAQYGQLQKLESARQENALNLMKMDEYKRGIQEQNALRTAIRPDFDPTNSAHVAEIYKAAPTLAPKFVESALMTKKTAGDIAKTTQETNAAKMKALGIGLVSAVQDPSDAGIDRALSTLDAQGIDTKPIRQQFASMTDPAQRKALITSYATQHPEGIAALNFVAPKPKEIRVGDKVLSVDENPNSPTFQKTLSSNAINLSEYEKRQLDNEVKRIAISQGQLEVSRGQLGVSRGNLNLAQQRLDAEMATGNIKPETIDFAAEIYRQTGQIPALGMGKKAADARSQILNRAAELGTSGDKTPAAAAAADVVANKALNLGAGAAQRAAGTQIANVQIAANEANKMIEVAKPYVAKVNPTDYPVLNAAGNFIAKNTGDPNIVGLATALNSLVNTYARAINPKGTATVSDKQHAREIINTAMSKGQINEAFAVMNQEMNAALASGPEVREALRTGGPAVVPERAFKPAVVQGTGDYKYLGKESK